MMDSDVADEVRAAAAAAGIDLPDSSMGMEDEVRAPIASFQDQIINPDYERRRMTEAVARDAEAMTRRMAFDRPVHPLAAEGGAEDSAQGAMDAASTAGQAINQLFAPPEYNEPGPYLQVIEQAKNEGKWVLVNIQQAEVFASHTLNRDVWSDDTIQDIVTGSFVFWQRDDKSTEGEQFCQYYSCGHQLPTVCVIDPRTRRKVKAWDGRKWVESHAAAEYLFGFLDEYSMSRSPPALSPSSSPVMQFQDPPAAGAASDMKLVGLPEGLDDGPSEASPMPVEPQEPEKPAKEPACEMPEEPAEDVEHVKVSLRLPSGKRITRRFVPSDPLEVMFACASALAEEPASLIDLSTQFPKRSLRDLDGGLATTMKDAQVAGNMILVNVRSS